ncbi:MAG: RNA polymerase sigma factor, partial [Planctomycetota bacterium]
MQDVFVKLAQSHDRISIHRNLRNYLITCVINRIRTLRRDCKRLEETRHDQPGLGVSQINSPDHWAVLDEQMQQLSDAMT